MASALRKLRRLKGKTDPAEIKRVIEVLDTKAQAVFGGRHVPQLTAAELGTLVEEIDSTDKEALETQAGALYQGMQPKKTRAAKAVGVGKYVLAVMLLYSAVAGLYDAHLKNIHPDWLKFQLWGKNRQLYFNSDRVQVEFDMDTRVRSRDIPDNGDPSGVPWGKWVRAEGPTRLLTEFREEVDPTDPNNTRYRARNTYHNKNPLEMLAERLYQPGTPITITTVPGTPGQIPDPGQRYGLKLPQPPRRTQHK